LAVPLVAVEDVDEEVDEADVSRRFELACMGVGMADVAELVNEEGGGGGATGACVLFCPGICMLVEWLANGMATRLTAGATTGAGMTTDGVSTLTVGAGTAWLLSR
jgi:hypothetical protein